MLISLTDGIKQRGRPKKGADSAPFPTLPQVAAREGVSPSVRPVGFTLLAWPGSHEALR